MLGAAGYMVVAHVILVSAQVLLVLTLGLWTLDFGLGLDNTVFSLVRTAAVRSLRKLAVGNQALAILALDFLVDMFNDEIEQVSRVHVYSTQSFLAL